MPELQLQLLGQFRIIYLDAPVATVQQTRLQSLLTYLILHRGEPQLRQHLAFLFWPESTEAQALTNLRKLLLHVRRALPTAEQILDINTRTVQWNPQFADEVDIEQFEQALAAATTATEDAAIAPLQIAVALYRGDLLPACYDAWIESPRAALRAKYIQALERLVLLLEDERDYPAAIATAHRLLRDDPLHETTYRRLMRLHALNGNHAAALQAYYQCVTALAQGLDVTPGPQTRAAYDRLTNQDIPAMLRRPSAPLENLPFVGRQDQWRLLQTTWREVMRGRAHFALIVGEAGIGKTRLTEELLAWAGQQGVVAARTRAYAAEGGLAYAPVIEWLRTPTFKARLLELGKAWQMELARLLPELLDEPPGLPAPPPVTESWQRHRLFEALARALLEGSRPLLLVLDNLQWCDQETLEWLHYLLRYEPQARLLVVGTARPEEIGLRHPLTSLLTELSHDQQLTELELTALNADDTAQLARHLLGRPISAELVSRLHRDTEGYPLYVVETVRANRQAWDDDVQAWPAIPVDPSSGFGPGSLPPKIRAVIDSRLAQLSPLARKIADLAAVIGRNFTFIALAQAGDVTEEELVQALDELLARYLVREREADGYDFSHDKLRDAVYMKLSATRRRVLHRRIAEALMTIHKGNVEQVSSRIAAHFEQAGLAEQATPHYARAAQAALRVYAHAEAIDLFQKALALLAVLPENADHNKEELTILIRLGPVLVGMRGYAGRQVEEVYLRAQHLTQALGEPPNPAILRALALFYVVQRDFANVQACGGQILNLAKQTNDPTDSILHVEAHYVLGVNMFWRGEFVQAKEHLELALSYYDQRQHEIHTAFYSQDAGVVCLMRFAFVLWFLGYPEQAQQRCAEAMALTRQFNHPFTLVYALTFAAWLNCSCRDFAATATFAAEVPECCRRYNLQFWLPLSLILQGYLLAEQGEIDVGIADIRAGIIAFQNARVELYHPYSLAILAQAYAKNDAPEDGVSFLEEAITSIEQYGDHWYEAELHRLKGELLLQSGADDRVIEDCFQRARTLARGQQAKSLELRAALSLARLWARQGKQSEARALLNPIYNWFTEGFTMPDLQEAKAFLDELT